MTDPKPPQSEHPNQACAHLNIEYEKTPEPGGAWSDSWRCRLCKMPFVPRLPTAPPAPTATEKVVEIELTVPENAFRVPRDPGRKLVIARQGEPLAPDEAGPTEGELVDLASQLPNVVEFPGPLAPGDAIGAESLMVFEVRRLATVLTMAGEQRALFIAIHAKNRDGSNCTLFVDLGGEQREFPAAGRASLEAENAELRRERSDRGQMIDLLKSQLGDALTSRAKYVEAADMLRAARDAAIKERDELSRSLDDAVAVRNDRWERAKKAEARCRELESQLSAATGKKGY